jgi:uncharacterized cupin superfamily protein
MSGQIINIDELDFQPWGHGERFEARIGAIGARIGAAKLGYNLTVVPPGKRAWPFHSHRVNEELFFILDGSGEIRIGEMRYPIRNGDFVACPPGGPETAHQIINTSADLELRYLSISTQESPELAEYPDSGKYGLLARGPAGPDGKPQLLRFIVRDQASMEDYWEGE